MLTNLDNTIIGAGGFGGAHTIPATNLPVVNKGRIAADKDAYRPEDVDVLAIDGIGRQ